MNRFLSFILTAWIVASIWLGCVGNCLSAEVTIVVTDPTVGRVPCRMHLKDAAGKAVLSKEYPSWKEHFVFPGQAKLTLEPGEYTFELERGPEYQSVAGTLTIEDDSKSELEITLPRITNMAADGWWSGELHVHRDVEDVELLMRAEDLHVAPVITWWNNRNLWKDHPLPKKLLVKFDSNRFYHLMAGEDEREGGALMYFNLGRPLPITGAGREHPSPLTFLKMARAHRGVWIDIEKPFWWDVPIWLASGEVDSIGLANNHMCHSRMYEDEAWGKPRDAKRLPPPRGNGMWTQELYYRVLEAGLRIPPSAGSASGVLPNPVGYNRVYVKLDGELTYEKWWEGLRAGRSFVTNGPLLRVTANGENPGHVFAAAAGERLPISLSVDVTGRDEIEAIEVIQNGKVVQTVRPDAATYFGSLPNIEFDASGWFLVRARCKNPRTFRFASTAPFYVEIGTEKHRISKAAAEFFLDWVNERSARVKLSDPQMRQDVLKYHDAAREFWRGRIDAANVE